MTTLLTGGTGFVGQQLISRLEDVTVTSRNRERAMQKLQGQVSNVIEWPNVREPLPIPPDAQFDTVINLMGESIAEGRWTEAKKKRIRESRVLGTRQLVDAILKLERRPQVLVSASAIGIYGDSGEAIVNEDHAYGSGYLTDVCEEWEAESFRLAEHGVRVVCLRIGIVLGEGGGAIGKMETLFRWGIGGKLGNGKQWMAWIHVEDLVSMIAWAAEKKTVIGPLNATAPNPVRNSEFTRELARAVHRPAFLPAPKFALRLVLGEFANSLFFSQRVVPAAALQAGFQFKFPDVASALQDVVN